MRRLRRLRVDEHRVRRDHSWRRGIQARHALAAWWACVRWLLRHCQESFLRTQQQIAKILSNANRTPGRQLWSGSQWIWSQGRHGSCNAQAIAGAVMRARSLRRLDYIKLSGSGLYAWLNDGVDRGSGLEEGRIAIEQKGVPIADGLDDGAFFTMRTLPKKNQDEAYRFRSETFRVDTQDELASGVALGMIVLWRSLQTASTSSSIAMAFAGGGGGMGNHSVGVCDVRIRNGPV